MTQVFMGSVLIKLRLKAMSLCMLLCVSCLFFACKPSHPRLKEVKAEYISRRPN